MNLLTILLFAILVLVSTQPDAVSRTTVAEVAITHAAGIRTDIDHTTTDPASSSLTDQSAVQADGGGLADVTRDVVATRLADASTQLRQRFLPR